MTNDKTVTMSRELAEQFLAGGRQCDREQLRALLDAPIPFPGYPLVPEDRKLPAVQPQAEPVAYLDLEKIQRGGMAYATKMRVNHRQSALYAYPPAPAAVVMPKRREPTPNSPHLTDADHEWNACIDKVKELNQ